MFVNRAAKPPTPIIMVPTTRSVGHRLTRINGVDVKVPIAAVDNSLQGMRGLPFNNLPFASYPHINPIKNAMTQEEPDYKQM